MGSITRIRRPRSADRGVPRPKTTRTTSAPLGTQPPSAALWTNSTVEVRRSPIQGDGVFALRDIARGERIIEYIGERIDDDQATARYDDEAMEHHHTFLFAVRPNVVIDAMRGGNESRFINHSCAPNCESVVERGRVFIHARRRIPAGTELTYDYWYSADESYSLRDLRRLYPCRCGAKTCRGTIAAPRR
jgi:SET domain-containing protein